MSKTLQLKISTLILLVILSKSVLSNCELYNYGFHTVATYTSASLENKYFFDYNYYDKYLFLSSHKFSSTTFEGSLSSFEDTKKKINAIYYNRELCRLSDDKLVITSLTSQLESIRLRSCLSESLEPEKGLAVFDKKSNILAIPKKIELIKIKRNMIAIENKIKKKISKMLLMGTEEYVINTKNLEYVNFKHTQVDPAGTIYSLITVEVINTAITIKNRIHRKTIPQTIKNFSFYLVTMTNAEGVVWHIGDSGQNHCSSKINTLIRIDKKSQKANLGYPIDVLDSYDTDNDGHVDILSFGFKGLSYYVEFGKELVVIRNKEYRLENWDYNYGNTK